MPAAEDAHFAKKKNVVNKRSNCAEDVRQNLNIDENQAAAIANPFRCKRKRSANGA